ncbi:MAG: tRNA lysidine(34) synthetase TilS [Clostridiales bacterium 38-18]|nr:MAG: tRNA lysidine(34) synthetase TilS [Clostridiales bacterium 38-18]
MVDKILETIKTHNMIQEGDTIIIGLSGGPDSLALTNVLYTLKDQLKVSLVAVHINHLLRGEAADADERFVKSYCDERSIPCFIFRKNIAQIAEQMKLSFEEAGRNARYDAFDWVARSYSSYKIAVAHNKNDISETFFINLMRGAGIDGLSSIDYFRDNHIIRPLLECARFEIEAYCRVCNLTPRIDHTNHENHYLRNKIRNQLIPKMDEIFEMDSVDAIFRSTEILKNEKAFIQKHIETIYNQVSVQENDSIAIELSSFNRLSNAEKYHLIRLCIKKMRGHLTNISYDRITRIANLKRVGAMIEIDACFSVRLGSDKLYFYNASKLKLENQTLRSGDLKVRNVSKSELGSYKLSNTQVAIDADKIVGKLSIRNRQSGDIFVPLGMKGNKKVKSFFIDEKVPFIRRDQLRLVCDEEKIIWIEDMRISDLVKISSDTKNICIMTFQELVELD